MSRTAKTPFLSRGGQGKRQDLVLLIFTPSLFVSESWLQAKKKKKAKMTSTANLKVRVVPLGLLVFTSLPRLSSGRGEVSRHDFLLQKSQTSSWTEHTTPVSFVAAHVRMCEKIPREVWGQSRKLICFPVLVLRQYVSGPRGSLILGAVERHHTQQLSD